MSSLLPDAAILRLKDPAVRRLVVGLSGGVDSISLLHAVSQIDQDKPVVGLHINHGLNEAAADYEQRAAEFCEECGAKSIAIGVEVRPDGSLETAAREARYAAFEDYLQPFDLLLLAHHQDDQVETILFRLLRGSRKPGLDGMPMERQVGSALLFRPLLGKTRAQITQYATANQLRWVEDPGNSDLEHDRNYLRHELVPVIDSRWPGFRQRLVEALARDSRMRTRLDESYSRFLDDVESELGALPLAGLSALRGLELVDCLSFWIQSHAAPLPATSFLMEIANNIESGSRVDACTVEIEIRQAGEYLYLLRPLPAAPSGVFELKEGNTDLPGGSLSNNRVKGVGLRPGAYTFSFRQGGEHLQLQHKRSLKNLFQEGGLPRWLRGRLPLVYEGAELVAIAGVPVWGFQMQIAEGYQVSCDETGLEIALEVNDRWP